MPLLPVRHSDQLFANNFFFLVIVVHAYNSRTLEAGSGDCEFKATGGYKVPGWLQKHENTLAQNQNKQTQYGSVEMTQCVKALASNLTI